jgi:DNA-binding beta-propeller fold protein YncE
MTPEPGIHTAVMIGVVALILCIVPTSAYLVSAQPGRGDLATAVSAQHFAIDPIGSAGGLSPHPAQEGPTVAHTLVLFNDSLAAGNHLAGNGIEPVEFAYDGQRGEIFVTDYYTGDVSVINDTIDEVVETIHGEWGPDPIAYDNERGEIFVGTLAGRVNVFNDTMNQVAASVYIGTPPEGIVYASGMGEVYVTDGTNLVSVINDTSDSIVANVTVPNFASYIGYDNGKDEVFVDSGYSSNNTLSVISAHTNLIVANLTVPSGTPAYDPSNGELFVADGNRNLSIVSDTTNRLVSNLSVGRGTDAVVYDPASGDLYVGNDGSTNVTIVSATTKSIVANVSVGDPTYGLLYDSGNQEVFAMTGSGQLEIVSARTNSLVGSVQVYSEPYGMAYDSAKSELFVTDMQQYTGGQEAPGTIYVINSTTQREVAEVPVAAGPFKLAYDAAKGEIFVVARGSKDVSVISDATDTTVANITVGYIPDAIQYISGRGQVFVGDASNNISVINDTTDTVVANITLGGPAAGFGYVADKGEVYATDGTQNVSVINDTTDSVVGTILISDLGSNVVYDSAKGELFVVALTPYADEDRSHVSVINVTNDSVVATVPVGNASAGLTYDASTGEVFVTNSYEVYTGNNSTGNVSVISDRSNKVVATVTVGDEPVAATWDPANGYIYVSNYAGGTISILAASNTSPLSTVTFNETGLASNTMWNLSIGNVSDFNLNGPILFTLANGTYPFKLGTVPGYSAVPESGNITVNGSAVLTSIAFYPLPPPSRYLIGFDETGLPSGTIWSVNLEGAVAYSSAALIGYAVGNGTYSFAIDTVSGYSATPQSGNLTVNGSSISATIVFHLLPPPTSYLATFRETGLPSGGSWSVTVGGEEQNSTNPEISFDLTNGTYPFEVADSVGYTAIPDSGSVIVEGSALSESVVFTLVKYSVTFIEAGLPPGTDWSVRLNGSSQVSELGNITFTEPNGTYDYTARTSDPAYAPASYAGSVVVDGAPAHVDVAFISTETTINFTESGLPAGTNWTVSIGGEQLETSAAHILFSELNGTYAYTVGVVTGYAASPASGSVDVNGTPVAVPISFTAIQPATYTVTFQETGLPAGTNWSVTLATRTMFSSNSTISFQQLNGSFVYEVGQVAGYTFRTPDSSVFIFGTPVEVIVPFTPISTPHSSSPTNDYAILALVAAVVVVASAIIVMLWRRKVPPPSEVEPPPAQGNGHRRPP